MEGGRILRNSQIIILGICIAAATGNKIGFMRNAKMGVFQITPVTSTDVPKFYP